MKSWIVFIGLVLVLALGACSATGGGGMGGPTFDAALTAAAEATGLSVADIRAQTAAGQTLAAIIEANGGDVAAVRAALVEALSAQPEAAEMNVEQMADRLLGERVAGGGSAICHAPPYAYAIHHLPIGPTAWTIA